VDIVDTVLPGGRGTEVACFADDLGAAAIEMSGYPRVVDDLERSERLHLLKPDGVQALLPTIEICSDKVGRADVGETANADATTNRKGDAMTPHLVQALAVTLSVMLTAAWCALLVRGARMLIFG
jgi:hypothetical protein